MSNSNSDRHEFEKSSRSLKCFALALVNLILITGVIVAAARVKNNPIAPKVKTKTNSSTISITSKPLAASLEVSSHTVARLFTANGSAVPFVKLQAISTDKEGFPTHIKEAIKMLDSYLKKTLNISDGGWHRLRCFAWNIDSVTNTTELFECR